MEGVDFSGNFVFLSKTDDEISLVCDVERIGLAKGTGSHRMIFRDPAGPGDELALLSSERQCLKNGIPTPKHGFYQYTAAYDSKHTVTLEKGKSARVLFEYREALEGASRP